ncbi:MAG: homoserine dehydrogenase [Candidatus Sulfotelmatobacter sp.]
MWKSGASAPRQSIPDKKGFSPREDFVIRTFNLCFLGFGNVNRTLVRLLEEKRPELANRYNITFRITGVASRRLGWIANPEGLCGAGTLARESSPHLSDLTAGNSVAKTIQDWLSTARADILFEATSLNVETGAPAISHIRAALEHGAHAITANKGPIVHAYRELRDFAAKQGRHFLFESTVMDGIPIFSLFPQLPAIHLKGFHGILNSTTNVILGEMEQGLTFDEALKKAQALGVAETDAAHDIDGWDAAIKTAALINVLMRSNENDVPIRLDQIARDGIRHLTPQALRTARRDGWAFKLVCRARRTSSSGSSGIEASVQPEKIRSNEPMARINGTSSYIYFETDIFPGLAITEENPGLYATAYGLLADFVRAVS